LPENDVVSSLMIFQVSDTGEGFDEVPSGNNW